MTSDDMETSAPRKEPGQRAHETFHGDEDDCAYRWTSDWEDLPDVTQSRWARVEAALATARPDEQAEAALADARDSFLDAMGEEIVPPARPDEPDDALLAGPIAKHTAALTARVEALEAALRFYADPEIYKPHPHGPAFDRRDLSWHARDALAALRAPSSAETMREAPELQYPGYPPGGYNQPATPQRGWMDKGGVWHYGEKFPDPGSAPVEGWRWVSKHGKPRTSPDHGGEEWLLTWSENSATYDVACIDGGWGPNEEVSLLGVDAYRWLANFPPPPAEPSRDAQEGERS